MKYLFLYILLITMPVYAQVGINTINPQMGTLHIDGAGNNPVSGSPIPSQTIDDVFIDSNGFLGVGHILPSVKLHIKTSGIEYPIMIEDGSQTFQGLLGSDAQGNALWGHAGEKAIVKGNLGTGVSYNISQVPGTPNNWRDTHAYIDLPPGVWMLTVTMLLSTSNVLGATNSSYSWIRSTFSDAPAAPSSADIQPKFLSGIAYGFTKGTLEGFVTVNNLGTTTKRYYYSVGMSDLLTLPATANLTDFAINSANENYILAFKIKNN